MQVPSQMQWWSNLSTQLLHSPQWLALGGLKIKQDSQNFRCIIIGLLVWFTCKKETLSSEVAVAYLFGKSSPPWIFQMRPGKIPGSIKAVRTRKTEVASCKYQKKNDWNLPIQTALPKKFKSKYFMFLWNTSTRQSNYKTAKLSNHL